MIRPAVFEDIERMVVLLDYLFSIEEDFNFEAARQRRGLEMLLRSDTALVLVVEADGEVVGMISGQLLISTAQGGLSLLVEDLVVNKGWQGKGLGRLLLSEVSAWGRRKGATRAQLLADLNNRGGVAFYQKRGWQTTNLICLRSFQSENHDETCSNYRLADLSPGRSTVSGDGAGRISETKNDIQS